MLGSMQERKAVEILKKHEEVVAVKRRGPFIGCVIDSSKVEHNENLAPPPPYLVRLQLVNTGEVSYAERYSCGTVNPHWHWPSNDALRCAMACYREIDALDN